MSAPTQTQIDNTQAAAFDVRLRWFSGPPYAMCTYANWVPGSAVWVNIDSPPAGWTEITSRVYHDGSRHIRWEGSSITWELDLRGQDYAETLLGVGIAVACFWRITRPAYDSGWVLWCLGQVSEGSEVDNYKLGGAWARKLRGTDASLDRANGPRLTAGAVDLARGQTPTVSSTLAGGGIALEAGKGEFVGAVADVTAGNMTDGNINTLWISNGVPGMTEETNQINVGWKINEVFFKPAAGFALADTWWVELYWGGDPHGYPDNSFKSWGAVFINQDGIRLALDATCPAQGYGLIVSDLAAFDSYTGGAPGASFIIEARSLTARRCSDLAPMAFNMSATNGFLQLVHGTPRDWSGGVFDGHECVDAVAWSTTGAALGIEGWGGPSVNVGALPVGQSIKRINPGQDDGGAADWRFNAYPTPGGRAAPDRHEYVILPLATIDSTLVTDSLAGENHLHLSSVQGWVTPTADSMQGIIGGAEVFAYTGVDRAANTLTGVSGLLAGHVTGTSVLPYVNGSTNICHPVSTITLHRRAGLPGLQNWRIYVSSRQSPRVVDAEAGWESDWFPYSGSAWVGGVDNLPAVPDYGIGLWDGTNPFNRIRNVMLVVDRMTDGGRAKVNEIRAYLAGAEVPGKTGLDQLRSGSLAAYLMATVPANVGVMKFIDYTASRPAWVGALGTHALAIAPYTRVLDDLARSTGCLVRYGDGGAVEWLQDPWWSVGWSESAAFYTFMASDIRGDIRCNQRGRTCDAVAVGARSPNGMRAWRFIAPPGGDQPGRQVKEFADYVVPDNGISGPMLAYALLFQEQQQDTASWTVKGVGDWCTPATWVGLAWDLRGDGTAEYTDWLITDVTQEWSDNGGKRTWQTTLDARAFGMRMSAI